MRIAVAFNSKINLLGTAIDNVTMEEALQTIERFIHEKNNRMVFTPTVDHLVKLKSDAEFREAYERCDLVLPDGMPLLWAGIFLGTPFKQKVSGSDLFPLFCVLAARKGYRLFLLGSPPGVASKASQILKAKSPGLQVVGTYSPPFDFEEDENENRKMVRMIRAAKPDILFVGLGAPKQEKWIAKYKNDYQCPVSMGVGASFDFVVDPRKRAPRWMSHAGLEWFWRLLHEPRRLWKRYLIKDPIFFYWVLLQKLKRL